MRRSANPLNEKFETCWRCGKAWPDQSAYESQSCPCEKTLHIVTDSMMGAAEYARGLMEKTERPVKLIGTMHGLLDLPDGAKVQVYQVNGSPHPKNDLCEAARLMIARGNFVGFQHSEG